MADVDSCESDFEIDEGCTENYRCLLCDFESVLVPEFFDHLSDSHAWNLKEEKRLFEDQFLWITFVNWARQTKPSDMSDFFQLPIENRLSFAQPVIENDAVLMIDVETILESSGDHDETRLEELRKENEFLHLQIAKCREFINELSNRPTLEYAQPAQKSHHGYALARSLIVSAYQPFSLLLDKFVLRDFQSLISKCSDGYIRSKVVLNLFEDGGLLSIFAAKAGAKRVLIQRSESSGLALALARANACEDKIIVIQDLQSALANRVDVLFCDWMNSLLHKTDQSEMFSLQSKVGALVPPIACLHIVGIYVDESLVKSLIPSSTFIDTNTSPLVEAAYRRVYHGNWYNDLIEEVTDVEELVKCEFQSAGKPENLQIDFSLKAYMTAQINGLLIYFDYANESGDVIISSKESQFLGQSLIILSKSISTFEKSVIFGNIKINWKEVIRITMQPGEPADQIDTGFITL